VSHEMISVEAPAGPAEGYLTRPGSGEGPWPGVLFVMDAIGLRPRIEEMADRIASWGYVVLAPNVFYRDGTADELAPSGELSTAQARSEFFAQAMPRVHALTDDLSVPDLSAYLDALQALPDVRPGDLGVTGYCMGGRLALLAAATRPDVVGAIGIFHAGRLVTDAPDSPHRRLTEVRAEVLALHADHDQSLPPEAVAEFEHALTSTGVVHRASVYPDAAHGYTMSDTPAYHHEASERHFSDLEELFGRVL
jgi:carboxymethylenebutenolidase